MVDFEVPDVDYTRYTNRQLMTIPVVVLAIALVVLSGWYVVTGAPVNQGIDFTGGTEMTVQTDTPREDIESQFDPAPTSIQSVTNQDNRYILTFKASSESDQDFSTQARENLQPDDGQDVVLSSQTVSANFGGSTQRTALFGVGLAFLGMTILAFLLFRTFIPGLGIVLSAFSDMVVPLALMNVFGINLSLGTVAALLMLIGYSVDSDILLTNHILRRSGGFYESTYQAMRTGVTMTLTSLSAMAVMAIVAFIFRIDLLASIGLVLVFGLATDLMNTYMFNVSLLRWYKIGGVEA
ncbi:MAG: preprotein translocase subunit SecF [Halobacteriales archaeon]|jgi:preprotein translocase subunit SecF